MWSRSWLVYCDIGKKVICEHGAHQHFLTAFVTIFQYLFPALKLKYAFIFKKDLQFIGW